MGFGEQRSRAEMKCCRDESIREEMIEKINYNMTVPQLVGSVIPGRCHWKCVGFVVQEACCHGDLFFG